MTMTSTTAVDVPLGSVGEWVFIEEIWKEGSWVDSNREIEIPAGMQIAFRHNMMWPPWHWQVSLGQGRHGFYLADGWNKFQARLDVPGGANVVTWIL